MQNRKTDFNQKDVWRDEKEAGRRSAVCFPYCLLVMSISFYYSQFIPIGPGIDRNCILIKALPFSSGVLSGLSIKLMAYQSIYVNNEKHHDVCQYLLLLTSLFSAFRLIDGYES